MVCFRYLFISFIHFLLFILLIVSLSFISSDVVISLFHFFFHYTVFFIKKSNPVTTHNCTILERLGFFTWILTSLTPSRSTTVVRLALDGYRSLNRRDISKYQVIMVPSAHTPHSQLPHGLYFFITTRFLLLYKHSHRVRPRPSSTPQAPKTACASVVGLFVVAR